MDGVCQRLKAEDEEGPGPSEDECAQPFFQDGALDIKPDPLTLSPPAPGDPDGCPEAPAADHPDSPDARDEWQTPAVPPDDAPDVQADPLALSASDEDLRANTSRLSRSKSGHLRFSVEEGFRRGTSVYQAEDGHSYLVRYRPRNSDRLYLKCYYSEGHNGFQCPATATVKGLYLQRRRMHSHPVLPLDLQVRRNAVAMRQVLRANPDAPNHNIFQAIARGAAGEAHPWSAARQMLARVRREQSAPSPETPAEAVDALQAADASTRSYFAFYARVGGEEAAIGLEARAVVEMARRQAARGSAVVMQADTSLAAVPRPFAQLLLVLLAAPGRAIPAYWVLMSHRTRHLYGAVLGAIGRRLRVAPATFLAGWEDGLQAAAQAVWPQASVSGGWFHYARAVLGQIRRAGLTAEYKQPATDFGRWARKLLTVPLVPADRLEDVWALLLDREAPETPPELRPQVALLRRYMQEWRQLEAERLCVHDQPRRVSDHAEDAVAALASKFLSAHPNFWLFVEKTNSAINDANKHGEAAQAGQLAQVRSLRDNRQQLQAKLAALTKALEGGLPLEKYVGAVIHLFRRRITALEKEKPHG